MIKFIKLEGIITDIYPTPCHLLHQTLSHTHTQMEGCVYHLSVWFVGFHQFHWLSFFHQHNLRVSKPGYIQGPASQKGHNSSGATAQVLKHTHTELSVRPSEVEAWPCTDTFDVQLL